ncbi:MAG TPA: acylphosphatase [Longimicrobiales bacterium]|nr:acylphosphatase [Longimicrobiales bacterium]
MTDEGSDTRRGFRVSGRVQGVGFRWWTRRTAQRLGLGGSVRNLPDGTVEVHAAGPADVVARLEAALQEGPPGARVDAVSVIPADPSVSRADFVIVS